MAEQLGRLDWYRVRQASAWVVALMVGGTLLVATGQAQESAVTTQQAKMKVLDMIDGTWRGEAWMLLPTGQRQELTQTERAGSLLGGAVKVVEGRGYNQDGETVFNALGVITFDPQKQEYTMRSYANGRMGDFVVQPREDGFTWEIAAGPATIRYVAQIKDGKWTEYGERIVPGQEPIRFLEMTLTRIGDSDWPAAGAIPHK